MKYCDKKCVTFDMDNSPTVSWHTEFPAELRSNDYLKNKLFLHLNK